MSKTEFLKDFEETLRYNWRQSESTIRSRIPYAEKLIDFLGDHPLVATRRDLREFLKKNGTQNAHKTIRVIYGRYLDADLAEDIKIPQSGFKPKRIPSDEKVRETFHKLQDRELKAAFLISTTSGIRRGELISLTPESIDVENRAIYPVENKATKKRWISFYNEEAELYVLELIEDCSGGNLISYSKDHITKAFREASLEACDEKITPQVLRDWFAEKMGRLGVPDRYIDAFCGRVPQSVLARHYTDFSPRKLKEVYEKAGIKVLK